MKCKKTAIKTIAAKATWEIKQMNNTTNKTELKVSELIKNTCYGTLLDVPKRKLVEMAKNLEEENERLSSELKKIKGSNKTALIIFLIYLFSGIVSLTTILTAI